MASLSVNMTDLKSGVMFLYSLSSFFPKVANARLIKMQSTEKNSKNTLKSYILVKIMVVMVLNLLNTLRKKKSLKSIARTKN